MSRADKKNNDDNSMHKTSNSLQSMFRDCACHSQLQMLVLRCEFRLTNTLLNFEIRLRVQIRKLNCLT